MALLSVDGLSVAYGSQPALEQVSFTLAPGEILGVVGGSGSGKSTFLLAIAGLLAGNARITSGRIVHPAADLFPQLRRMLPECLRAHFQGAALNERALSALRGNAIGMIFQDPAASFCPVRTIGDQLHETLNAQHPCSRAESDAAAAALFTQLGLAAPEKLLSSYPFALSGGMSQRVALAIAMLLNPALLLADEPTSALDMISQRQVLDALSFLRQKNGSAIVLVTHNIGVCERLADQVIVLQSGRIVEAGPTAQVFSSPQAAYTKELLAAVPRLRRK